MHMVNELIWYANLRAETETDSEGAAVAPQHAEKDSIEMNIPMLPING